jgi:hypothetical protein
MDQFTVQVAVQSNQSTLERVRANIVCNDAFLLTGPTLTILEVQFYLVVYFFQLSEHCSAFFEVCLKFKLLTVLLTLFFELRTIIDSTQGLGDAPCLPGCGEVRDRRAARHRASVGPWAQQLHSLVRGGAERRARAEGLRQPALIDSMTRTATLIAFRGYSRESGSYT